MDPIATDSTAFADIDSLTPAMRQFAEVKLRYPGTLVLFRMGDFYETFFDDAGKANRLIGITLTKRGKLADGTPIPMARLSERHELEKPERLDGVGLFTVLDLELK